MCLSKKKINWEPGECLYDSVFLKKCGHVIYCPNQIIVNIQEDTTNYYIMTTDINLDFIRVDQDV